MNTDGSPEDIRAFQILAEVADEEPISQRELAKRLGVALGLVNSYLKNFIAKGYIRIKNYPRNRYAYLLTPSGMAEKARLACQHVNYFTNLYTVTRQNYLRLFHELKRQGITRVGFCGVDEVAEIAWLSLQEVGLELTAVMDAQPSGRAFMGRQVLDLEEGLSGTWQCLVITSIKRHDHLRDLLRQMQVEDRCITGIGEQSNPATAPEYEQHSV